MFVKNYKAEALRTMAAIKAYNMKPEGFTKGLPNPNNNRTLKPFKPSALLKWA